MELEQESIAADSVKMILTESFSPEEADFKMAVDGTNINELFEQYCLDELEMPLRFDLFT